MMENKSFKSKFSVKRLHTSPHLLPDQNDTKETDWYKTKQGKICGKVHGSTLYEVCSSQPHQGHRSLVNKSFHNFVVEKNKVHTKRNHAPCHSFSLACFCTSKCPWRHFALGEGLVIGVIVSCWTFIWNFCFPASMCPILLCSFILLGVCASSASFSLLGHSVHLV